FAVLNGRYLERPYAVDVLNGDVQVNGQVARPLPLTEKPPSAADLAAADLGPDADGRPPPTAEEIMAGQVSMATDWRDLLQEDGVLLTSQYTTAELPPGPALPFLAGLLDAWADPPAPSLDQLASLTGPLPLAAVFLPAAAPPPA